MSKLLFICYKNRTRSVIAEFCLRDKSQKNGINMEIYSAGIGLPRKSGMSKYAKIVLAENKILIKDHYSKTIDRVLEYGPFDCVLCMEKFHKTRALRYPGLGNRIFTLGEGAGFPDKEVLSYEKRKKQASFYEKILLLILHKKIKKRMYMDIYNEINECLDIIVNKIKK